MQLQLKLDIEKFSKCLTGAMEPGFGVLQGKVEKFGNLLGGALLDVAPLLR